MLVLLVVLLILEIDFEGANKLRLDFINVDCTRRNEGVGAAVVGVSVGSFITEVVLLSFILLLLLINGNDVVVVVVVGSI